MREVEAKDQKLLGPNASVRDLLQTLFQNKSYILENPWAQGHFLHF
jgi:hypothetical protein